MAKITCEHCKATIEDCPECSEEIEQHIFLPLIFFMLCLATAITAGYRWQSSLGKHEEAMRMRKAYLKSNPEVRKLPISLR